MQCCFFGQNPKNALGADWWDLWDDNTGFDYDHFMRVYPDGTTSETRKFYQTIAELGCKSIETNVYSHSHNQPSSISNKQVLHVLLDNLPRDKQIGLIPHGKNAQHFISTYTVPDEWRILEPPLRTLLGRASNDEKDRAKRFCQRMIPMNPPERRNLESLQVNSKNSKESHQ